MKQKLTRDEIIEIVEEFIIDEEGFNPARLREGLEWLRGFPGVIKTIIKSGDAELAYLWAYDWASHFIIHRDALAQVIIEAGDAQQAYMWASYIGTHLPAMAEVIIKAGDAEHALYWAITNRTRLDQMAGVILKSGNVFCASRWIEDIGTHKTEMQEVIDSKEKGEK